MAILSPHKSRRLRTQKGETTQQVITFQIQHEWFALPIETVKKVVPRSETHGGYHGPGVGLTVYEGKELLVLDIKQQVFGHIRDRASLPSPTSSSPEASSAPQPPDQTPPGYLVIIRSLQGEMVGFPVETPPSVRRVPQSALVPLPASYAAKVNIQCVSGLIVQSDDQPILFFLNPEQLLHSQPLLPPTT